MTASEIINAGELNELGEGPCWDPNGDCLLWVDVLAGTLYRRGSASPQVDSWRMPKRPTSIALIGQAGMAIVFRRQIGFASQPGYVIEMFDVGTCLKPDERLNDSTVDGKGRLWVGSMDLHQRSPVGSIYRLDAERGFLRVADGFVVTNGMAWSAEGETLFVVESAWQQVIAYHGESDGGSLGKRRVIYQYPDGEMPDGLTMDTDGNLWVAVVGGGRVDCLSPEGHLLRSVTVPTRNPTSCAFGGVGMDTLYVTSLRLGMSERALAEDPMAGGLFAIPTDSRGLGPEALSRETELYLRKRAAVCA